MTDLEVCSVAGCSSKVSKPGYKLCYEHWLADKKAQSNKAGNVEAIAKKQDVKPDAVNAKSSNLLTATTLGERLGLSNWKLNQVLSELGWIEKDRKGWIPTEQGRKLQAEGKKHHVTGVPFVLWPEGILSSRILLNSVKELLGTKDSEPHAALEAIPSMLEVQADHRAGFREKFIPTHRATDGHWVRSKAEALIDNWLYMSGVVHAYERLLPVEEELYCDFYIPKGRVYLEYWGLENDPKYKARKEAKQGIYKKYNFNGS